MSKPNNGIKPMNTSAYNSKVFLTNEHISILDLVLRY